jgi:hypothetical protein
MKVNLLVAVLFLYSQTLLSQTDTTIWNDMKKVEGDNYSFYVPQKWRDMDMTMYKMLHYYEASGLAFPLTYNGNNPVIVILTMVKMKQDNLEDIKKEISEGYSENPDRVFPDNFKFEIEEFTLGSSEKAYLINTRFYRKSKGLQQSRFDLAIYSGKAKLGYMFTISIQYSDETYHFENDFRLKDFSKKFYSYFSLN